MNHFKCALLALVVVMLALVLPTADTFGQGMTIDLGKVPVTSRYISLVGNTSGSDGEVSNTFITPEYCARNVGTSMYFAIDDSFFYQMPAGQFVLVNVEYYDAPGVQIKLVYDAIGNPAKEHGQTLTTTGTNSWKSYQFILDDAYFGNGLANGADFKLVAAAGQMSINAVSVVPFEAYMHYGTVRDSVNMTVKEEQGGDSKTVIVTKEGEECITTTAIDNYLYIDVADTFIVAGNHPYVFVAVEYYDEDPTKTMRLQYDGPSSYTSTGFVHGKGWNSFRTYTFEISDANFNNRENGIGGSDMRLQISQPGLAIRQILLARLPKKPYRTFDIAGNTAYKALESPIVDGSLKEWSWLKPYALVPRYNSAQLRIDEFYRTWVMNSANVPVAEVGEPNVSDPGVPGLWDTKDLTGGVSVLWDDDNLYVSAVVKDNVVDVTGANWDEKDGFGFFIDVSHDTKVVGGSVVPVEKRDDATYTQGEHFIFLPATNTELGWWKHSTSQSGEALPTTVHKAVVLTDSGYVIEASIPLDLLRDGLTWKPGVAGDQDNFNPLFGWTLNDADGISASSGRLMMGAHSDDDEFWGVLSLNPIPLVDRGITIDFGVKNYEKFVKQVELAGDGVVVPTPVDSKTAVKTTGGYVYLDVDDNVIFGGNHPHVLVSVEYFDSSSGATNFRLQYDAADQAYKDTRTVTVGNTNTWKTEIFDITDANFAGRQNSSADLRLHCPTNDLLLNQVHIAIADLWIDLGDTVTAWGLNETQLGGDGIRYPITVGGVNCKRNDMGPGYGNAARYFYHNVADTIFKGSTTNHREILLTVEYYDTTCTSGIGMNYDGVNNQWSNPGGDAFITGSSQWKLHTFYLPDAKFTNLENGGSDFRITGNGSGTAFINRILVGTLEPFTGVEVSSEQPLTFALSQNYPNPFNPTTKIQYDIPSRGLVILKVYNILGQQVASLVNMDQTAGRHVISWDASQMASGVYFYRLTHNNNTLVQKMMLLK